MAEVSGIGGADYSVAKGGFPPDENGKLNRPDRADARTEDSGASPARSNETQTEQRSTQPSQTTNDGEAQQNAANTGDFNAGGTDRRADTVVISAEARNAVLADGTDTPGGATQAAGPAVADTSEAPRRATAARDAVERASEPEPRGPAQSAASAPSPAANAAAARDVGETAAADQTNQSVRNENSNAEVNGSEADQSEQSRTIGQVIDVFA